MNFPVLVACGWQGRNKTPWTGLHPRSRISTTGCGEMGSPTLHPRAPKRSATKVADAQTIDGFGQSGAAVGLFAPDYKPATNETITTSVRRLGYARRELLETTCGLSQDLLDRRPQGKRSVRENLEHVANAQGFYLTRVFGWQRTATALPEPWSDDVFERLGWVMVRCVAELLAMPERLRRDVFAAQAPSEKWTARNAPGSPCSIGSDSPGRNARRTTGQREASASA